MVPNVDQNWFLNLFSRSRKLQPEDIQTRADDGNAEAQFVLGSRCLAGGWNGTGLPAGGPLVSQSGKTRSCPGSIRARNDVG